MRAVEKISRKIACLIDDEIRSMGLNPETVYRNQRLTHKVWRIRSGRCLSLKGISGILDSAQKSNRA